MQRPHLFNRILAKLRSIIFLAVVTLLILFFSLRTLTINNQQNIVDFSFTIDSSFVIKTKSKYILLPGNYQYTAFANGYNTKTGTIALGFADSHIDYDITLLKSGSKLKINLLSNIEFSNVTPKPLVKLNNQEFFADSATFIIQDLAIASYDLTISQQLFKDFTATVAISDLGKNYELDAKLEPNWAEVMITTEPKSAKIVINSTEIESGTVLKLPIDFYLANINIAGYEPQLLSFELTKAGYSNTLTLKPSRILLTIATNPKGASLLLNNKFVGLTPVDLTVVPVVANKFKFFLPGYKTKIVTTSFAINTTATTVAFDLEQVPVFVTFKTTPNNAKIKLKSKVISANSKQQLQLDMYALEVFARGYITQSFSLDLKQSYSPTIVTNLITPKQQFWLQTKSEYIAKDNTEMLLFTANDKVSIGSPIKELHRRVNEGRHFVNLANWYFYVAKTEVSNKQYRVFNPKHSSNQYKFNSLNNDKQSVVNISWQQAAKYCNWLSQQSGLQEFYTEKNNAIAGFNINANGYRLLNEAEWEWLSRYDNNTKSIRPYTAKFDYSRSINIADESASNIVNYFVDDYNDGYKVASNVAVGELNANGLYNFAGNVAEWLNDWYKSDWYLLAKGSKWGPNNGEYHLIRGASWKKGYAGQLRWSYRDYATKGKQDLGFRVARTVFVPEYAK